MKNLINKLTMLVFVKQGSTKQIYFVTQNVTRVRLVINIINVCN